MQRETLTAILRLLENVVSKDNNERFAHVRVTKEYIEGTNGVIMARVSHNDIDLIEHISKGSCDELFVPREAKDLIKHVLKNNKGAEKLILEETYDILQIGASRFGYARSNYFEHKMYPDLDRIVPKDETRKFHKVRLDAKLLLNLAKALNEGKVPSAKGYVELNFSDNPNDSILVKSNGNFGVLMPVRL